MRGLYAGVFLLIFQVIVAADACTVLEFTGEGFSPNVMWLLHAYPLYTMNGSFFLDSKLWPHHCKETGGGWGDFFASDQEVIDWTPEKEKAGGEVCLRQKAQHVDELLHKLGTGTEELDGMAVNKLWRFKPAVQKVVNATLRELKGLNNPTVAFHIRGGDLSADLQQNKRKPVSPQQYVDRALEAFGKKAKGGTCVILGDDHKLMGETAKIAKAKLGCAIYRRPPYYRKAGHIQSEFNKEPLAKRCAHTVQFLQDVELMTHADYFVGTFHSNLPKIIQTLRFSLLHKDKRTFADASDLKADWYERVREYFREDAKQRKGKKTMPAAYAAASQHRSLLSWLH
ncbi:g9117 [Coccomyxa elongata]